EQNLSSDNNSLEPSNLSYKDQNLESFTILQPISSHSMITSDNSSDLSEQLPIKQKMKIHEINIQPLIQELRIEPLEEDTVKMVNVDKNFTDNQSPAIKLYSYKKFFEKRHSEILPNILKNKPHLTKQKAYKLASSQIYNEMLCYLLGIFRVNLRKKTQLTKPIYKLFNEIGEDKILRIKTYSANKLSKLTDTQIDTIIYE
ncbi:10594_t:CDS:2, partial [Racocetra persica]